MSFDQYFLKCNFPERESSLQRAIKGVDVCHFVGSCCEAWGRDEGNNVRDVVGSWQASCLKYMNCQPCRPRSSFHVSRLKSDNMAELVAIDL